MKLFLLITLSFSLFAEQYREGNIRIYAPEGTEIIVYGEKNQKIKQISMVSTSQNLKTPALEVGYPYQYDFVFTLRGQQPFRYTVKFNGGENKSINVLDLQREGGGRVVETRSGQGQKGHIKIFVPNRRAIIIINGNKMEDQEGELREFHTPRLLQNETRNYKIRLEYTDDATNRKIERDKTITVGAGETVTLKLEDFLPEIK